MNTRKMILRIAFLICVQHFNANDAYNIVSDKPRLHPVILVPGDGGSQIEARLNKTSVGHWWCSKTSDWYDLWLNINEMLTFMVQCWAENVALEYDPDTRTTRNSPGVETRIPGFGNTTTSVEWIDKSMRGFSTYFSKIVEKVLPQGYIRGQNIHGAPYDFRRAANENQEYFVKLKTLIEETYQKNDNTPVLMVTHSMGSIMTLYFLNHQTQAWKDKYIRSLISIAGVWGGTARAVKVFAVGDNLDSWFLNEKNLLWERTNPSLAWLMPSADFWPDDEILVETDQKNFTRTNLHEFFEALEEPNMSMMVEDTKPLIAGLTPPGVEVFCTHGSKVDTTERLIYPPGAFPFNRTKLMEIKNNSTAGVGMAFWPFPSKDPTMIKGDGDGTVNIRSLQGCLRWKDQQKQPVHHKVFEGVNHLDMLRQEEPAQVVADIITNLNKELNRKVKTLKKKLVDETITNLNKELNRNMKSILREKLVEKKKEVVPIIEVTG